MKSPGRPVVSLCALTAALCGTAVPGGGQVHRYPYHEGFDSIASASLPPGWSSSRSRAGGVDDFALSSSSPKSGAGCLLATNATMGQELMSPVFDCSGLFPSDIEFSTRRSATFGSPIVVEASVDSGKTFPYSVGDTLRQDGAAGYVSWRLRVIPEAAGCPGFRLRWRTIPSAAGASGALRFDEFSFRVLRPPGEDRMVISEILYEPFAGQAEFVELFNAGRDSAWLSGWQLSDRAGTRGPSPACVIPDLPDPVPPGGFVVVAQDSSGLPDIPREARLILAGTGWPALNNLGDDVVLRDGAGSLRDSVAFIPAWHTPGIPDRRGRSLERVGPTLPSNAPTTWATCVSPSGCTPGRANSVFQNPPGDQARLSCFPNPFSPDADGREDAALIQYHLPGGVWSVGLAVYDVRGRLVRNLCSALPASGVGSLAWDGRDDLRRRVRVGMYVVVMEAWEPGGNRSLAGHCVAVVAGR
jgi:hypothetical protein